MSARTGGLILLQLLLDLARAGGTRRPRAQRARRSDAWIDAVGGAPAQRGRGARLGAAVEAIELRGRPHRRRDRRRRAPRDAADYYVAALPVEVMRDARSRRAAARRAAR